MIRTPNKMHLWSRRGEHTDKKDTKCEKCLNTSFRLRRGYYVLMAKCTACGHEQEVYSG